MTDKEILEEVYRKLKEPLYLSPRERRGFVWKCRDAASYIEQEWQRRDEIEAKLDEIEKKESGKKNEKNDHPLTKWDEGQQYFIDTGEMERHRGLEIGEDGTVKSLT